MKEKFIEIFKLNISRPGSDKLLAWLETTDFFEAPASTRFHLSRPGGLVEHSIHVYDRLLKLYIAEKTDPVQPRRASGRSTRFMWSTTSSPTATARSRSTSSLAS